MQFIETKELMVPGDRFEINADHWERLAHPWRCIAPSPIRRSVVECEVLRVYVRSPYELRYVCQRINHRRNSEFVLAQFLGEPYVVTATAGELRVSGLVFCGAAAKVGARPISEFMPNCYSKEDAEAIAQEIKRMELTERYGYLSPANQP